jgi:hypothetical protein
MSDINFTFCLQECVTVTGKRSDGGSKTQPKPLREAAIQHAKEITQQHMLDSLDQGKKTKKKKRKVPPHVLDMGSPELSELGDTSSFREEPIHIEFSAKEPSAEDRRFADVIRFKLACEAELKMYGDSEEYRDQVTAAKKEWIKANTLYKTLLQQRSSVLGTPPDVIEDSYVGAAAAPQYQNTSLDKLAPRPKRRRQIQEDEDDLPASSSSSLTDGLYCKPLQDDQVSPGTLQAIRKVQEFEDDEETV